MERDRPLARDFDALWNYGDPVGTEERFRSLLPGARSDDDPTYLTELLTQIARCEGLQQKFDDAHRTLDEVESLLPAAGAAARIRADLERGRVFSSAQQPEAARPLFLHAWEHARQAGEDFHAVDAAHMLAIVEPPDRQVEWAERAIRLAESSADPRAHGWLGSLYNNLGWTYHDLGRYEDALTTFRRGLAWQEAAGKEKEARIATWTVARTLRSLGRYDEALGMQQVNAARLAQVGEDDGYAQEEIGECLLALGREGEAGPHFARAYAKLAGDPWLQRDEPERLERLAKLGGIERP